MYWLLPIAAGLVPLYYTLSNIVAIIGVLRGLWKMVRWCASWLPGLGYLEAKKDATIAESGQSTPPHQPAGNPSVAQMQKRSLQKTYAYFNFFKTVFAFCVVIWAIIWAFALFTNYTVGSIEAEKEADYWKRENTTYFKWCTDTGVYRPDAWKTAPTDVIDKCARVKAYVNSPTFSNAEFIWSYIVAHQKWAGYWTFNGLTSGMSRFARIGWVTAGVMTLGIIISILCGLVVWDVLTRANVVTTGELAESPFERKKTKKKEKGVAIDSVEKEGDAPKELPKVEIASEVTGSKGKGKID
jgi:hypothetical protein